MRTKPGRPVRYRYQRILTLCFVVVMLLPLLFTNFRPLVSKALAAQEEWYEPGADGFERWREGFNHEFGGRGALMHPQALVKFDVFDASPTERVILGRDHWLYLGRYQGYDRLEDYLRLHPFTPEQVQQWVDHFETKRQLLAQRGIPYVLLFAPNKFSIYPEYLPPGLHPRPYHSRLEDMMTALRAQGNIDALDMTDVLLRHKDKERIYYKTDTHWNQAGGLQVYQALLQHLQTIEPQLQPLPVVHLPNQVAPRTNLPIIGGMADMVVEDDGDPAYHVDGGPEQETLAWTRQHGPDPAHPKPSGYLPLAIRTLDRDKAQMQRGLFIGDSFWGYGLGEYLSQHFAHAETSFCHTLDLQQLDRVKPQIVVEEMVEEDLSLPMGAPSPTLP